MTLPGLRRQLRNCGGQNPAPKAPATPAAPAGAPANTNKCRVKVQRRGYSEFTEVKLERCGANPCCTLNEHHVMHVHTTLYNRTAIRFGVRSSGAAGWRRNASASHHYTHARVAASPHTFRIVHAHMAMAV